MVEKDAKFCFKVANRKENSLFPAGFMEPLDFCSGQEP